MADDRFGWYERVRVSSDDPAKAAINGKLGAILGKAQSEDGSWTYGVHLYDTQLTWVCASDELISTGEFDRRETFYSGNSLRVSRRGELLE